MFLNFYYSFAVSSLVLLSYVVLTFNMYVNSSYLNLLDTLSRVNTSDFFINNYYYTWTIFWYIPIFIITVYLLVSYFSNHLKIKILVLLIIITFILNLGEVIDYWYLNTYAVDVKFHGEFINNLLTNSINKYHPLILYLSISLLYSFILYSLNLIVCFDLLSNQKDYQISFNKYIHSTIYFNYIALALGSWWALQEGSWGGWWNWDPSEVFGFVVFISTVFYIHKQFRNARVVINTIDLLLVLILIVLLYYFMQLNFNLISHNFGLRGTELVDKLQLYWTIALSLIYIQIKIICNTMWYINYKISINTNLLGIMTYYNAPNIIYNIIFLALVILVGISYYPIILNFVLNLTGVTISSIPNYTAIVIIYISIFTMLNFINPINFNFLFATMVLVYIDINTLNFLIIFLLFKYSYIHLNHKYILIFILVSFTNYYKHTLTWLIDSENFFWSPAFNNYFIGLLNFSVNSNLIEFNNGTKVINNQYILPNVGLCSLCSTSEINIFLHETTISLPLQILTNGSLLKFFLTVSYEYNLNALVGTSILVNILFCFNILGSYNLKR